MNYFVLRVVRHLLVYAGAALSLISLAHAQPPSVGLRFWLDASDVDADGNADALPLGTPVGSWVDKVGGLTFDVHPDFESGLEPVLDAINGTSAVKFNGDTLLQELDLGGAAFLTDSHGSLVTVYSNRNDGVTGSQDGYLLLAGDATGPLGPSLVVLDDGVTTDSGGVGLISVPDATEYLVRSGPPKVNDGNPHWSTVIADGSSWQFFTDALGPNPTVDVAGQGNPGTWYGGASGSYSGLFLGSLVDGVDEFGGIPASGEWMGSVAEILIYDHPLTVAERASVDGYVQAKYGLSGGVVATTFNNAGGDGLWGTAANWDNGVPGPPSGAPTANINGDFVAAIGSSTSANASIVEIGGGAANDNSRVELNGGSLTADSVHVGRVGVGNLRINGGTVTVNAAIDLGEQGAGRLEVTGGMLTSQTISTATSESGNGPHTIAVAGSGVLTSSASISVGVRQSAAMLVEDEGHVTTGVLGVGGVADVGGVEATVDVSGHATVDATSLIVLGQLGHGLLAVSDSGEVTTETLAMGRGDDASSRGTLFVSGGSITVTGDFVSGLDAKEAGNRFVNDIQISGGNVDVTRLLASDADHTITTISMTGGALTLTDLGLPSRFVVDGATAHLQLDGGTVEVLGASFAGITDPNYAQEAPVGFRLTDASTTPSDPTDTTSGSLDITDGSLVLAGDATTLIHEYVDLGILTGFGGAGLVQFDFDVTQSGKTTVSAFQPSVCDFDFDQDCDIEDLDDLVSALGTGDLTFDLNEDQSVDAFDVADWLHVAGQENIGRAYLPGDANLDGVLNEVDFAIWEANRFTAETAWSSADFSLDGVTDVADFNVWNENRVAGSEGAVPEPAGGWLLASAVLVLSSCRRH